jgi:outer membrane autotransporter protein
MGWGFTRSVSAYLGFDHARINSADATLADNYGLNQLDLGLQYSFMNNDRAWRPFVEAAATRRSLNADVNDQGTTYNMSTYGYGMTLGTGFQYFVSQPWAISTGLNYSFGKFTHAEVDGQSGDIDPIKAQGMRLNVGMSWHPMARR